MLSFRELSVLTVNAQQVWSYMMNAGAETRLAKKLPRAASAREVAREN